MRKTLRQACAALLLAISVLAAPACGVRIDPNATPQQVEQAQLRDLQRMAGIVERVGYLVLSLQNTEIALHRLGRISPGTHESVQTYLKLSAEFVISELESAKDAAKSPLERRHSIMRALKFVDNLQTGLIDKIPDEDVKAKLQPYIMSIQTLLTVWQLMAAGGAPSDSPQLSLAQWELWADHVVASEVIH